ncbi:MULTISPECIES: hypothetical protein [Azotobacter]|nr:hypothetical protein [Azotobacter vinelandii]GLK61036.1 hypothetical protein GCM10017624_31990 [Azotobacter vinelandii]SFY31750.1 hypothetical protein SAMN04244547_05063 [Azotobacter vinelandii]
MTITYKYVIEALVDDFRSMHEESQRPDVKLNFDGDPKHLALVTPEPAMEFSYRFSDSEIMNHRDLFYCLIIASHELAHWTNAHTKHSDKDDLDSKAIETWADFFGTRLLFTGITYGARLQEIILKLRTPVFDISAQHALLEAYGNALRCVYENVFKRADASSKYPSPNERVRICGAGVTSFFYRLFGKMHQGMSIFSLKKTILEPFGDLDFFKDDIGWEEVSEISRRTIDIHLKLKQGRPLITPGIRQEYNQLIGTHYLGHEENAIHRERLQDAIRQWGIEV